MRNTILILISLMLAGCAGSLKGSWNNFRGYYNTFYNAKKSYASGIKKVQNRPVEVDPDGIVRVHATPPAAGRSDFDKAIDKGASLLRKFPDSKWADDALLLIGKSYYYQQDYFPALQKFEELYNLAEEEKMKELAVLWKGITLLEQEEHIEGVNYLESALSELSFTGRSSLRGEVMVTLAEHQAMLENWLRSSELLGEALTRLNTGPFKGKTYFLYGQTLERQGRLGEAYFAYSNVESNFPDYEYIYWSKVKLADVARQQGNLDKAISIYQSVKKDDKNFNRRNYLELEIGRTYEMKKDYTAALARYKQVLRNNQPAAGREIKSRAYFRIGQIYSDQFKRFGLAAAYFDSSSQSGNTQSADQLADAYGRYTELHNRANRIDSLLWLGTLPPAKLDSVLMEAKRRKEAARKQEKEQDEGRTLTNVNQNRMQQGTGSSSNYGFLNYRNTNRVAESKYEFQAVWGDRPLADHWRRAEAISGISTSREDSRQNDKMAQNSRQLNVPTGEASIDVSDIPQTREERELLQDELAEIHFKKGNLFFLTLNLPDSAIAQYRKVIENHPDHRAAVQSMYSLFELYSSNQQPDSATYWGNRILEEYPRSVYAQKVSERLSGAGISTSTVDSMTVLHQEVREIESDSLLKPGMKAEAFQKLALENRNSGAAPHIYFRSIEEYIRLAKQYTDSTAYVRYMENEDASAGEIYPFLNEYWDSTRVAVSVFDTTFQETIYGSRINHLKSILLKEKAKTPDCASLGIELELLDSAAVQAGEVSITFPVTYSLLLNRNGEVLHSTLVTVSAPETALNAAAAALPALKFKPLEAQGLKIPDKVRCRYTFFPNKRIES